jgi:hypothetical protein
MSKRQARLRASSGVPPHSFHIVFEIAGLVKISFDINPTSAANNKPVNIKRNNHRRLEFWFSVVTVTFSESCLSWHRQLFYKRFQT